MSNHTYEIDDEGKEVVSHVLDHLTKTTNEMIKIIDNAFNENKKVKNDDRAKTCREMIELLQATQRQSTDLKIAVQGNRLTKDELLTFVDTIKKNQSKIEHGLGGINLNYEQYSKPLLNLEKAQANLPRLPKTLAKEPHWKKFISNVSSFGKVLLKNSPALLFRVPDIKSDLGKLKKERKQTKPFSKQEIVEMTSSKKPSNKL